MTAQYRKISPQLAKEMMDSGDPVTVVDVRTPSEYAAGHIEGAILIPNETITTASNPELLPNVDDTILVYCRSGNRSSQAARKLVSLGYTNVYDFGGINDWPYEIVR
jgi:rhodanese-related sulfurtransferase